MNPKTISPDDPRLTAYALGEMSEGERAEFEAQLAQDPAARQAVAEIRGLGGRLEAALATEPVPTTSTPVDRSVAKPAIAPEPDLRQRDGGRIVRRIRSTQWYYLASGLAAAGFVALIAVKAPEFAVTKASRTTPPPRAATATSKDAPAPATATPATANPTTKPSAPAAAVERLSPNPQPSVAADSNEPPPAGKNDQADALLPPLPKFADAVPTGTPPPPVLAGDQGLVAQAKAQAGTKSAALSESGPMWFAQPSSVLEREVRRMSAQKLRREAAARPTEARADSRDFRRVDAPGTTGGAAPAALGTVKEEPVALSPFAAEAPPPQGYAQATTFAGTRFARTRSFNTESYAYRPESDFVSVRAEPLSTFSADVDTASYANVRRFVARGELPPPDAVRIEELLNAFTYDYARPAGAVGAAGASDAPFAADLEVASAPWAPAHRLVRIGIRGRDVPIAGRGTANLVFLLDVSGSMADENKLPLVKRSMQLLLTRLRPEDRVAIVTYAGASGLALPSTPLSRRSEIEQAIEGLSAGGSTNGALGIQLAYDVAKANFVTGGVNRVILCTDGDFNVGTTSEGSLVRLIKEKAGTGVFLSVFGFGMGNLKDSMLQQVADAGNGNYGYIDTLTEAERRLVGQVNGTLVTIARDVKLQVEFNPARVSRYRLIGYEKRRLAAADFQNDSVDAGEIGAGHTVTALYEIEPATAGPAAATPEDESRPQRYVDFSAAPAARAAVARGDELLVLRIRYKQPDGVVSRKLEFPLKETGASFDHATPDFKFASAVAAFGMLLRDSAYAGTATFDTVVTWAEAGTVSDADGSRAEFVHLVRQAQALRR